MTLFTNPKIIISYNDAVIGYVHTDKPEISYLDFIALVKKRIYSLVVSGVKDNMNENIDHAAALKEVLHYVESYLTFDDLLDAFNEQQIADKIFTSREYLAFEASMYNRFMNLHKGVINVHTPINIGGDNDIYEDMDIENSDFMDILMSLSITTQVQP